MKDIFTNNQCHNVSSMPLKGDLMKTLLKRSCTAIAVFSLMTLGLILAGCGGGSGGASSEVVSGVAAVGDPLSGQVSLKDSSSPSKLKTTVIGSDGSFAFDVTDMQAPYVLQATGSAAGENYKLHSFADGTGTANINPLSDVIVATAAGDDDPEDVFEKADSAKCKRIRNNIQATVAVLLNKLQPLLKQYNAEHTNPITSRYIANHLDLDEMFDKVKIKVSKGILTIINKKSAAVIFSGKLSDVANGVFNGGSLPPTAAVPASPTALTAVGGNGQVTLSWAPVSNAASYNIYYSATSGVTTANGTKVALVSNPHLQTGLAAGTTYHFVVTAVNGAGESAASAQVSAATASIPPVPATPAAPTGIIATGGTKQVTLSWGTVSSAASYNVYYATSSGVTTANGTKLTNVTSPAVLGGLTDGTSYYYIVTAVNSAGESVPSIQVAAATLPATPSPMAPAAPTTVTAVGGTNQATITWPAVSGAVSYNVYWSAATGVTKTSGTKVAGVTSPYIKTGLAAGSTYYFIVTAVNSVGESAASSQATATTAAAPPALPAAPTGVTATGGANQVSISWPAVAGATSYNIYWASTPGVTKANGAKITNATTPYLQTGLAAGSSYYYIVTAVNSSGESVASAQASAATNAATPPPAPVCGSCHAIPPALGEHAFHAGQGIDCVTCHGAGYSSTTTNPATHMNGVKNVSLSVWNPTTRSCATYCHGSKPW